MSKRGFVIGDKFDTAAYTGDRRAQLNWTRWTQDGDPLRKDTTIGDGGMRFANVNPSAQPQGKMRKR